LDVEFDLLLVFGSDECEIGVARDLRSSLRIGAIDLVGAIGIKCLGRFGREGDRLLCVDTEFVTQCRIIRDFFGDDVFGSLDGFSDILHRCLHITCIFDKLCRFSLKLFCGQETGFQYDCERIESFGFRETCFGVFLLLIGTIEVFDTSEGRRITDLLLEFGSHESFLRDEVDDGFFTSFEILRIAIDIVEVTELFVGRSAGHLFTITSDEGDGISFIQEGDDGIDDGDGESGFVGDGL